MMNFDHHGVVHFEMVAENPEKLSQFYTNLFGWQITKMPMGETDYYSVTTGPTDANGMPTQPGYIGGGLAPRMMPEQKACNYVNVESVDQYLEKAKSLGATALSDKMPVPGMGWFAQLMDPEGNAFGIWQNDTSAG